MLFYEIYNLRSQKSTSSYNEVISNTHYQPKFFDLEVELKIVYIIEVFVVVVVLTHNFSRMQHLLQVILASTHLKCHFNCLRTLRLESESKKKGRF